MPSDPLIGLLLFIVGAGSAVAYFDALEDFPKLAATFAAVAIGSTLAGVVFLAVTVA